MNLSDIETAEKECHRFLGAASAAKKRIKCDTDWWSGRGTKETAACRRASMDLTRVLVYLRRGSV